VVQNGGSEYYYANDLPEDFRESFNSLDKGQVSVPLKSDSGYYIFRVEDKRGYYRGDIDAFLKEQRSRFKIWVFLD